MPAQEKDWRAEALRLGVPPGTVDEAPGSGIDLEFLVALVEQYGGTALAIVQEFIRRRKKPDGGGVTTRKVVLEVDGTVNGVKLLEGA
jgi:hypothetical protein